MSIKLIIADDHALLRQGIKNVLEFEADFEVIAEAGDGEEAVNKTAELKPDILLLDINMPKLNGLEVTRRISERLCSTKVIMLTIHDDENYVLEVIKAGAVGYLLKDVEPSMLIKAIRKVYEGESFIYPTLAKQLFGEIARRGDVLRNQVKDRLKKKNEERLTTRELEVLQLVGRGMSNNEIAQHLFLSEKTVKNHLTNIFRKISVTDRTQAVLYALKHKIVILQ